MQSFRIFYFLYEQDYCKVYSDSIHYPNRFICIVFGDSGGSIAVVVEITQNGNVNEYSGTDDKLSAFFLVFFSTLTTAEEPIILPMVVNPYLTQY